jgi:hypothetical protein
MDVHLTALFWQVKSAQIGLGVVRGVSIAFSIHHTQQTNKNKIKLSAKVPQKSFYCSTLPLPGRSLDLQSKQYTVARASCAVERLLEQRWFSL